MESLSLIFQNNNKTSLYWISMKQLKSSNMKIFFYPTLETMTGNCVVFFCLFNQFKRFLKGNSNCLQSSDFQLGVILSLREHWAMSENIFGCHSWAGVSASGISWVETRDAAQHPAVHGSASHRELRSPKCQQCRGQETPCGNHSHQCPQMWHNWHS